MFLSPKPRYLLLSLLIVVLDQWSKWWVETNLPEYVAQTVIPGLLNFTHVQNSGVAFGFLANTGRSGGAWILATLGIAALALVGVYFWKTPNSHRLLLTALALVLGGAVGNLIDRISAGSVTDFIDFYFGTYHWHTFNIADSAITVGIILIAWDTLRPRRAEEEALEEAPATASASADSTVHEPNA